MGTDEGIVTGFLDSALKSVGYAYRGDRGSFVLAAVLVDPGASEGALRPTGDGHWYLVTYSPETVLENPDLLDRWRGDLAHYVALTNVEEAFGTVEVE